MKLAELFVQILGDDKPLNQTLGGVRRNLLGFGGAGQLAGRGLGLGLARGAGGVVGAFAGLGRQAGNALRFGLLAGGAAAAAGLGAAVKGGADLNETLGKTGVVFGDQASVVTDAADAMAAAFATPKRAFLDAAGQFGIIAQGMGRTQEESAALSARLARLAVDAESLQNVPVPEVLEKIRAGLTGESEPLKALGVFLTEDAVKAEAMALGLAKAGKALTNSAKFAGRLSLIEKGLSIANGDMERTQGSAANQMRKTGNLMQNLGDAIGQGLAPAWAELLQAVNASISGMGASLASGQGRFHDFVQAVRGGIEEVGFVWRNFGDIWGLVSLDIAEMTLNVLGRVEWLGRSAAEVIRWLATSMYDGFRAIVRAGADFVDNIASIVAEVWAALTSLGKDPIEIHFKPILDGFQPNVNALKLPEFRPVSVDAERKPLLDAIGAREQKRLEDKAAEARAIAANPAGKIQASPDGVAGGEKKAGHADLAAFAKSLQEGIFGKDAAKETAANTRRGADAAVKLLAKLGGAAAGGAAGLAAGPE